ncbi:hypothetical protein B0T20DRAFT_12965 [Sordaria brevicollis]|uniref:Uncharacterized protein n=1 Tax=Sordaria brevicollis TaxID=83679 RepID=A0AAE0PN91_SORBR|nr:hypothetical protein B0T20DRAFT_12965 [Sordaria brevicollis]
MACRAVGGRRFPEWEAVQLGYTIRFRDRRSVDDIFMLCHVMSVLTDLCLVHLFRHPFSVQLAFPPLLSCIWHSFLFLLASSFFRLSPSLFSHFNAHRQCGVFLRFTYWYYGYGNAGSYSHGCMKDVFSNRKLSDILLKLYVSANTSRLSPIELSENQLETPMKISRFE